MFTGIIEKTSPVVSVAKDGVLRVRVRTPRGWKLAKGASVSINGICATVCAAGRGSFEVEFMRATLARTTAGGMRAGAVVNLERALRYGKRMDGHFVLGHVDDRATVVRLVRRGKSAELTALLSSPLRRFAVPRGSITVNGVALTIARRRGREVTAALIPYTLSHTNLGALMRGDEVNIEVDLLARYGRLPRRAKV